MAYLTGRAGVRVCAGVNRAFPYARAELDNATSERHVEALYREWCVVCGVW